jgi:hypothetical protein
MPLRPKDYREVELAKNPGHPAVLKQVQKLPVKSRSAPACIPLYHRPLAVIEGAGTNESQLDVR